MISNVFKIVAELKKRIEKPNTLLYSQIIKAERLRLSMTLQEMASGICSISYLSKVENREVEPNEEYLRPLLERVNINYDDLHFENVDEELYRCLRDYYYGNFDMFSSACSASNLFTIASSLIKAITYLSLRKYDEFKAEIAMIDKVKSTLDRALATYLFTLVIEYYNLTHQFNRAYELLLCNQELIDENSNPYIKLMHIDQFAKAAFYLRKEQLFNDMYTKLVEGIGLSNSVSRLREKRIMQLINRLEYNEKEVLTEVDMIRYGADLADTDFNLLYYVHFLLIKNGQYDYAFRSISETGYYIDNRYLSLLGYCAYKTNDDTMKARFSELFSKAEYSEVEEVHKRFSGLLKVLFIDNNNYDLLLYLRDYIVPFCEHYIHPLYDEIYEKLYVDVLSKMSKYKEATRFLASRR